MKKKSVCILLIFAAVIVLTYVTGESYYSGITKKAGLEKKEEKVYSLLDEIHPMTFENLLENSGFSAFELQHILMKFELKNIIYQIEQNVYLRKV